MDLVKQQSTHDDFGYLDPIEKTSTSNEYENEEEQFYTANNQYFNVDFVKQFETKLACKNLLNAYATNENNYLTILHIINNEYGFGLRSFFGHGKFLSEAIHEKIFKYFDKLLFFHTQFNRELELRVNKWDENPLVSDLFIKFRRDIEIYDDFIENFQISFKFLVDICNKSGEMVRYLNMKSNELKNKFSTQFKDESINLKSCMIQVAKWPDCCTFFLRSYLSLIDAEHDDFVNIQRILDGFDNLLKKCEDIIETSISYQNLIYLQRRLGNKVNLLSKKRKILKEGILTTVKSHIGIVDESYVILLNDLIVICEEPSHNRERLKLQRVIETIGLRVDQIDSVKRQRIPSNIKINLILFIYVPSISKTLKFLTRNQQEKDSWLKIFEIIESTNKIEKDNQNRLNIGKENPVWIPDECFNECCNCNTEFTTFNRRHHCRACGFIFCSKCSRNSIYLDYDDTDNKHRVCDNCYEQLKK